MRQEKLNRMRELASRVVARARVDETRFAEARNVFEDEDMTYPRDIVTALTEGSLGGIRFASWLPIAAEAMRHEGVKESIEARAQEYWRLHAFSHILKPSMLIGPKGKLPA